MAVASLADLLHETAEHHGSFKAVAAPHEWWDWYAACMVARQSGSTPEEASAAAGRLYGGCQVRRRVAHVSPYSLLYRRRRHRSGSRTRSIDVSSEPSRLRVLPR
jgi:hypothetical protein